MNPAGTSPRQPVCSTEVTMLLRENGQLREALDHRAVIEQAKGALMWRYRLRDEAAFGVLKRWSQSSNVKLHTVADTFVCVVCGSPVAPPMAELADWLREQVGEAETMSAASMSAGSDGFFPGRG